MGYVYDIGDLCEAVRVILDENDVATGILATDTNTLQLDEIIKSKVVEATNGILSQCPLEWCGEGEEMNFNSIINQVSDELGVVSVLKDSLYLRLLGAKMPDWDYPVTKTISFYSDEYKQQKSRYAGMRGNPQRPIVADVYNSLEFYTTRHTKPEYVRYLKRMVGDVESVTLPHELLRRVLEYQVAGLTCVTLKDSEHAQTLFAIAQGLMDVNSESSDIKA